MTPRIPKDGGGDLVFWLMVGLLVLLIGGALVGASQAAELAGVASFYGNESGSKTASGQRFDERALTCAHRSLPFGTRLRVSYRGRHVLVTVNDRGPFIRGRVLDLSTAAARAIGLEAAGVGHVTAEILK
jgi:rare lipoprotein A